MSTRDENVVRETVSNADDNKSAYPMKSILCRVIFKKVDRTEDDTPIYLGFFHMSTISHLHPFAFCWDMSYRSPRLKADKSKRAPVGLRNAVRNRLKETILKLNASFTEKELTLGDDVKLDMWYSTTLEVENWRQHSEDF